MFEDAEINHAAPVREASHCCASPSRKKPIAAINTMVSQLAKFQEIIVSSIAKRRLEGGGYLSNYFLDDSPKNYFGIIKCVLPAWIAAYVRTSYKFHLRSVLGQNAVKNSYQRHSNNCGNQEGGKRKQLE